MSSPPAEATFRDDADGTREEAFVLCLVIAGATARSRRAVTNLRAICDRHLAGRCDLQIVDIYQQPELAATLQVIVAPTLLRRAPQPIRRLVGDLSETDRVLAVLGLLVPPASGS